MKQQHLDPEDNEPTVRFTDPVDQAGFTQIPNVILRDNSLPPVTRFLWAQLASFAWGDKDYCFPGQERLAKAVGLSDRSVRHHLKELEAAGLVTIQRRGQGKPNIYWLNTLDRKPASTQDRKPASCKEDEVEEDEALKKLRKETGAQVREVFDYWQSTLNRERSKLTPTRRKKIEARLKAGATVQEIKRAIDGCAGSEFHTIGGHVDLTLICRSDEKLEEFQAKPKPEGEEDFFAGTDFS